MLNQVKTLIIFNIMSITRQDIETMLQDLKQQKHLKKQLDKELYLMDKYKELYTNFPFLIKKLTKIENDKENLKMLFLLVDNMTDINSGKKDKATVENELGQKLADKYIK